MINRDETTKEGLIYLISGDDFARAYFHTAMGDATDNHDNSLAYNYNMRDLDEKTLCEIWHNCKRFLGLAADLIEEEDRNGEDGHPHGFDQAGYDFYMTVAGAGVGFWEDWDWPRNGKKLTELCKRFKPLELYVGDDGVIYAFGAE